MKIAIIGECMVEMFQDEKPNLFHQTFAGDTFNCAVYLKRKFPKAQVEYISVVGNDDLSNKMIKFINEQDIQTNYIDKISQRTLGLYIINTKDGERSFTYYRNNSAAKKTLLTKSYEKISKDLSTFDMIYFSAITLAIMEEKGRKRLFGLLKKARKNGVKIAFDSNYRPLLYSSKKQAKKLYIKALKHSDIFLPSIDDEKALWGDVSSEDIIKRAKKLGCKEIVTKCGENTLVFSKKNTIKTQNIKALKKVIDTTAAGDSFNGAYLASRLKKYSQRKSILEAKKMAAKVIMTKGAIIPKDKK